MSKPIPKSKHVKERMKYKGIDGGQAEKLLNFNNEELVSNKNGAGTATCYGDYDEAAFAADLVRSNAKLEDIEEAIEELEEEKESRGERMKRSSHLQQKSERGHKESFDVCINDIISSIEEYIKKGISEDKGHFILSVDKIRRFNRSEVISTIKSRFKEAGYRIEAGAGDDIIISWDLE